MAVDQNTGVPRSEMKIAARLSHLIGIGLALALGTAAQAQDAAQTVWSKDPHLAHVPWTAAQTARAQAVLDTANSAQGFVPFEANPAGKATVPRRADATGFRAPTADLDPDARMNFTLGEALFEKLWVVPPSATTASDGLGPVFNARACSNCHPRNGRGHPDQTLPGGGLALFLRVSVPDAVSPLSQAQLAKMQSAPEPNYGHQIQEKSIAGVPAEARPTVRYSERVEVLDDGTEVALRVPHYGVEKVGYGPLHPEAMLSPRVAQQMIGLGLLEAIPAARLLGLADPEDTNGDGISGRANRVWNPEYGQWLLGRFGHKAGTGSVRQQSLAAAAGDIGLGNPLAPSPTGDCTALQVLCLAAPDGNTPAYQDLEVGDQVAGLMTYFSQNVGVPARPNAQAADVLTGKALFHAAGCAGCHTPAHVTHALPEQPAQSFQLIWPYSDLLLHDMGPDLADGRPEWAASGSEWRTPPLWGIGLTEAVTGAKSFLHDGRARSLTEAILWHGGEGAAARDNFAAMAASDRAALLAFVNSL